MFNIKDTKKTWSHNPVLQIGIVFPVAWKHSKAEFETSESAEKCWKSAEVLGARGGLYCRDCTLRNFVVCIYGVYIVITWLTKQRFQKQQSHLVSIYFECMQVQSQLRKHERKPFFTKLRAFLAALEEAKNVNKIFAEILKIGYKCKQHL